MQEKPIQTFPVAVTGGGTGGHVYPALAVIEELSQPLREGVLWIGSRTGMEGEIVRRAGIPFVGVSTGKLRRYFSLKNLTDPFRVVAGFFQARRILRKSGVRVLFSKGGFVAVPVVWAARTLSIPVAIHESDVAPGLATRLTMNAAAQIFVPYPESVDRFPERLRNKIRAAGNPVRRAMRGGNPSRALERIGAVDTGIPVVLVLGGSQGARQINELVWRSRSVICDEAFVVHQTGAGNHPPPVPASEPGSGRENYRYREYFTDELPDLYARADLVVSRAGAGTIWEIAANRRPAVLLPLSARVSRGDQIDNAGYYSVDGAAIVLDTDTVDDQLFVSTITGLLRNERQRRQMMEKAGLWSRIDAARTIAAWITGKPGGDSDGIIGL